MRPTKGMFELPFVLPGIGRDEFDGETYAKDIDYARLKGQLERVFKLMQDGEYRTLREIADECRASEASVSARLRDLRKPKFGSYVVDRRRVSEGLWTYAIKMEAGSGRDK
jgi:hypothetical protein